MSYSIPAGGDLLLPYGLRVADDLMVRPTEVPRGAGCAARQPELAQIRAAARAKRIQESGEAA